MKQHLYILWTNADPITAENMVFMYGTNALMKGWWEEVMIIVWGAPAKLVAEEKAVQKLVRKAQEAGVRLVACKACADQLGVSAELQALDIEVFYTGQLLTDILKNDEKLLTV